MVKIKKILINSPFPLTLSGRDLHFDVLCLLNVASLFLIGELMTDEVMRVSRMFPASHIKSVIHAYGALYLEQVVGAVRSLTVAHACMRALGLLILSIVNLWFWIKHWKMIHLTLHLHRKNNKDKKKKKC